MPEHSLIPYHSDFSQIYMMIEQAQASAWRRVNKTLINLYWDIGEYISQKTEQESWGKAVVEELSDYIISKNTGIKGFSARNIWRMKSFYETYKEDQFLSTLLTEIDWSSHLHILSKTKTPEERKFYLTLFAKHRCTTREVERLIDSGTYERTIIGNEKLPTALSEFPGLTKNVFKDLYSFDFLGLPEGHKESDLKKALVRNLRNFLLEIGPDFSLLGEEYVVQVGGKDFRIDLLLHNRALNCLTAIELKITEFQPEYLGKLQFYLEALDRDVKKHHENPSIGILICKTKDDEVVKYALNRSMSPTMIAEYETKLIDKKRLQEKLHEISQSLSAINEEEIS